MFPASVQTHVFNKRAPLVLPYWSVARTLGRNVSKAKSSNVPSSVKQQTCVTRDWNFMTSPTAGKNDILVRKLPLKPPIKL